MKVKEEQKGVESEESEDDKKEILPVTSSQAIDSLSNMKTQVTAHIKTIKTQTNQMIQGQKTEIHEAYRNNLKDLREQIVAKRE